jgi:transposase
MPKPYSNDLRCKLLGAYEGGHGSLRTLASRFNVSYDYARKISAQRRRHGQMERVAQRPRPARIGRIVEAALTERFVEVRDCSICVLQQKVKAVLGLSISQSYLWQIRKRIRAHMTLAA